MEVKKKKEVILQYIRDNPKLNNTELAVKLLEDIPDFYTSVESLRRYISTTKEREGVEKVVVPAAEEKPKWEVLNGKYNWTSGHGQISLPVELIDQLFYEYSEHGLNLSQTEILNKHNLKVWQWNSIKSTLWLFKKSNIFSPYTVEQTPPEELKTMIAGKISAMFANTGLQVEKQYSKELNKKYKEVIKRQTLQDVTLQAMVLELSDSLKEANIQPCIRVDKETEGVINVFLFDLHYGAQSRTDYTQKYSPEIVREILIHVAETVNKIKAREVNIFFGGDYYEAVSGINHIDSWKGMARGFYGARVVLELYKLLVEFMSQINNLKSIFAVPGNHDRATDKREIDSEGSMAEILFELVRLSFQNKINIKYDEKLISESIDGIHYIMTHGHFKLTDVHPAELILRFGCPEKFNLLLSGHWHERRVKKDHEAFRHVVCPPLFVGNDYSVNLGYTSSPGFLIVKNNGFSNKPIVIDYTL